MSVDLRAIGTLSTSSEPAPPECWDGRTRIVSKVDGQWFYAGCGRLPCQVCAPLHARRLTRAMQRAAPAQLVTITLVGDDWQVIRARIARVRYRIARATQHPLHWAWVVEVNPAGTGHHVHAAKRGRWTKWSHFAGALAREGVGHGWLSPAADVRAPERYLTKYVAKGARAGWGEHLALNGGRLVHTSRGFWRDADGLPTTWRGARAGDGSWVRVISSRSVAHTDVVPQVADHCP